MEYCIFDRKICHFSFLPNMQTKKILPGQYYVKLFLHWIDWNYYSAIFVELASIYLQQIHVGYSLFVKSNVYWEKCTPEKKIASIRNMENVSCSLFNPQLCHITNEVIWIFASFHSISLQFFSLFHRLFSLFASVVSPVECCIKFPSVI